MSPLHLVGPGVVLFCDARDQLRQPAKMTELLSLPRGVLCAGGRQHVHASTIERLFLDAEFALALRELLVGELAVESHYVRREFFKLLREDDTAFRKVFALQFLNSFGGALDEIREADAEFDDPLIVVVIERLRHDAAFEDHGPELVGTPSVVVANADRGFARVATNDDKF